MARAESLLMGPEMGYNLTMTKLLDQAVEAVRGLPPEAQDDIASVVLYLSRNEEAPVRLSSEEQASFAASQAAAARGEFATDDQVRATWAKHGL
jgi:hypothetical protein